MIEKLYENEDVSQNDVLLKKHRINKKLEGFLIEGIFINKEVVKDMSVKFITMKDGDEASWITNNGENIVLSKKKLESIIKEGVSQIELFYFGDK